MGSADARTTAHRWTAGYSPLGGRPSAGGRAQRLVDRAGALRRGPRGRRHAGVLRRHGSPVGRFLRLAGMTMSLAQLLAVSALLSAAERAVEARGLPSADQAALEQAIEKVRANFWAEIDAGMSRARNIQTAV